MEGIRKHRGFCPHCGNKSPQRIVLEHKYCDTWYGEDGSIMPSGESPQSEAIICICETCDGLLVYDGVFFDEIGRWPELKYPRDGSLPTFVPESVRRVYHEAIAVKRNAPNAFAIMIRKSIEAICDDRDAPRGSLAVRLKFLVDKGDIPQSLADLTDVMRVVGNSAAHGSFQSITAPMTWAIDDFSELSLSTYI